MKWILLKTKINEKEFEDIENKLDVKFPLDFKNIVLENNGASPEQMSFDTLNTKERVAEYLLSFSPKDKDNILDVFNALGDRFPKKLIPVMKDPFGNYICIDFSKEDSQNLYFWNHENDTLEYISKTFTQFLDKLYE
ncbi:MAG: SMI1/KNR4 family protein [Aliarcobacter skirrowii]|uniref:SMI1/KNR4 family protein n=1 Tax=Aliarcobacter skirrowii TaxID=28200 RepID=UPI00243219A9|nr:SMI1/KNR4 family protein [Aliarcobacter skirrowii]MDD2507560.1 SMI1/KNR4 family protein [Aliarcobacter skirrowii]MDD3495912.1 SMI1/KNR4 family protein [Aliarcobacter skirrowii]